MTFSLQQSPSCHPPSMSLNGKYRDICCIHTKSCFLHAKSHVSLRSYYGSTCQRMTPVIPCVLTPATREITYSPTLSDSLKPTKKTARAQWSEFSAIKSDDDDDDDDNFLYNQSSIYHLNPFDESDDSLLIVPTTIFTSVTTCHQISFAKMKKQIPHLKGKVDLTKKPILHLKGKVDLTNDRL